MRPPPLVKYWRWKHGMILLRTQARSHLRAGCTTHRIASSLSQFWSPNATDLHPNYKNWLSNFISGRQAHVEYNNTNSITGQIKKSVPQGAVISPTLFNLFLHDLPSPQQPNVSIASYVDDLTLVSTDPNITIAANNLQLYLAQLENRLATNRMSVSAQKSSITVFTPNNKEYNSRPIITLNGTQTLEAPSTKILGTTYDRGKTFKDHTTDLTNKSKSRLNVLKAQTATTFGQQK